MGLYVIMLGVQGAGKGMQARHIQEKYNIPQVSTGDLFRAMKTRTDDLAVEVQTLMAKGALIPDDITNAMVADRLAQPDAANGVILDGYPRNAQQADFLDNYLAERGERVNAVIVLDLELYTAFKRAFGRVTDADGKSYNLFYNADGIDFEVVAHSDEGTFPPRIVGTHSASGEVLKRRKDDADALAIVNRIDTYLETTQPLIEYYDAKGILQTVPADQPISKVSSDIDTILEAVKVK